MHHTRLWVAATIIALIVLGSFVLSVPHTRDIEQTPVLKSVARTPSVTVRDLFKKGMHTIAGSVEVPNACTTVSAEASIASGEASSTESILVALTIPADEGICLQVPTHVAFQTTIAASTGLPIVVTVNGVTATTSSP